LGAPPPCGFNSVGGVGGDDGIEISAEDGFGPAITVGCLLDTNTARAMTKIQPARSRRVELAFIGYLSNHLKIPQVRCFFESDVQVILLRVSLFSSRLYK
jgi:hypothetical protein